MPREYTQEDVFALQQEVEKLGSTTWIAIENLEKKFHSLDSSLFSDTGEWAPKSEEIEIYTIQPPSLSTSIRQLSIQDIKK